jgi:hypothetical protein
MAGLRLGNLRFLVAKTPHFTSNFSALVKESQKPYYDKLEKSSPVFDFVRIKDVAEHNSDSLSAMKSFLLDRNPSCLYLEDSVIDEDSAKIIGEQVASGIIKTMSIKSCEFVRAGYEVLFNEVAQSKSLNLLVIDGVEDHLAGSVMANFFAKNNSLKDIILRLCDFGDNSLVIKSVKKSDSLESLSFSLDKKDESLIGAIDYLLHNNFTLRTLKFPLLEANSTEIIKLAKALGQNSYLEQFEISRKTLASHETLNEAIDIVSSTSCLEMIGLPSGDNGALREKLGAIEKKNTAIKEAISDYAKTILGPKLAKAVTDASLNDSTIDFRTYEERLLVLTKRILLKGLSNEEVLDIYNKWNSPFFRTQNGALKNYGNISWPILFKEKVVNIPAEDAEGVEGYSIAELNNPEELDENGKTLRHCVGGATAICHKGSHHIFALNFKGSAVATIGFLRDEDARLITLADFSGMGDSAPAMEIRRIPYKIIERFSREIDFDLLRGEKLKRLSQSNSFLESATKIIGFDWSDTSRAASLLRLFRGSGPLSLKPSFDELARCQNPIKIFNISGEHEVDLDLMGRYVKPKDYVALPLEEVRENEYRNKEAVRLQIPDIQKNIDQIYGAKKIVVKKDQSGFGTVALSFEKGHEELAQEIKAMKAFRGHRLETLEDGTLVARIGIKKVQAMFKKIASKKDPSSNPDPASGINVQETSRAL